MIIHELFTAIVTNCPNLTHRENSTAQCVTWVKIWKMAHIQNYASQTRTVGQKMLKLVHVYEEWMPNDIVFPALTQGYLRTSGMSEKEKIMSILDCIYIGSSTMIYMYPLRQCQVVPILCTSGNFCENMKILCPEISQII